MEHLHDDNDPHYQIEDGDRAMEGGCRSASTSPLPQRRGADRNAGSPEHDLHGFHLGTLPHNETKDDPPPIPKMRHVYAMVSKNTDSTGGKASKGSPPSPLPKPKRGGSSPKQHVEEKSRESSPCVDKSQKVGGIFDDIPRLEVAEQPEMQSSVIPPLPTDDGADKKPRDEDTVSLEGIPSSEISHELADGGQIYAVVNKNTKKKKGSVKKDVMEEPVGSTADVSPVPPAELGEGNDASGKPPKKKAPPKPPRIRPPKPAPYIARAGSPVPTLLAAERSSPVPPPSPDSISQDTPSVPDHRKQNVEETISPSEPTHPASPATPSPIAGMLCNEYTRSILYTTHTSMYMYMSIRCCICTCAWACTCIYGVVYAHVHGRVHVYTVLYMHMYMGVYIRCCICTCTWACTCTYGVVYAHVHGRVHVYTVLYITCTWACTWTCIYGVVYAHVHIHVCIYMYIVHCTCMHMHIHIHVHVHVHVSNCDILHFIHTHTLYTDKERERKVSLDVEQQRARLSDVGPPSFPPPPPPQDNSPLPPQDHMYETPPALMQTKPQQDSLQEHDTKQTSKPPVAAPSDEKIKDDWTPGYDVVSNPKKVKSAKCSPDSPLKNSPPEESAQQLSPSMQLKIGDRTKTCRSTVFVRSPHLYESVPDDRFENSADECARPKTILVPMRSHIYESPDEVRKKVRKKPPPKKRPPPPPPTNVTTPTKTDNNVPMIATGPAEQVDPPTPPARPKSNVNNALTSPVAEIVSNPVSYLGADLGGKRLTVDFQYDMKDDEKDAKEPKFLFNKGHSSSFIRVS